MGLDMAHVAGPGCTIAFVRQAKVGKDTVGVWRRGKGVNDDDKRGGAGNIDRNRMTAAPNTFTNLVG